MKDILVSRSRCTSSPWTLYNRYDMLWDCTSNNVVLPGAMDGKISISFGVVVNLNDYYETNNIDINEDFITSNPNSPELTEYETSDCKKFEVLDPR